MDFCPNCGSMILPGKSVCSSCGASKNMIIEKHKGNISKHPSRKRNKKIKKPKNNISEYDSNYENKLFNEFADELKLNKDYFDNLHDVELDNQQRLACVIDRDNLQIVAGAGTGKTFTIISKIKYLIDKKGVNPNEILCMSFTRASVDDLKDKIPRGVDVYTFNGLGNLIVHRYSKDEILDVVGDGKKEFKQVFREYVESSSQKVQSDIFDLANEFMSKNNKEKLKEIDDFDEKLNFSLANTSMVKFIQEFISLFKSMEYGVDDFNKLKQSSDSGNFIEMLDAMKNNKFLEIVKPIYLAYQGYLHRNHLIDYDDMIIKSNKLINDDQCDFKYKYIFVDEYQDISFSNYNLIKSIKSRTNAKLIVVGDDWQSIYGFRDSNVKFFTNFEKYFPNPTRVFIETTYRSSQELIKTAGDFVSDNHLIKKSLKSDLHRSKPIKIVYCSPERDTGLYVENLIKELSSISEEVLILGRHVNDIDKLIVDTDFKKRGNIVVDKAFRIYDKEDKSMDNVFFRTIHSAKGLEADNVIISAVTDDFLGFPNKIFTKSYSSILHDWDDSSKQQEERRLFYVALTRTKNDVYIFTQYNNESKFIKELKRDNGEHIEIIEI